MADRRLSILKGVLWVLVGVLASVTAVRMIFGLGAVTHLSDGVPWGFWVGFKISCVALSAGGFVLAATVYIFGLERYRPFVRPAVLTALLGYVTFVACLIYDLGLPWRVWHPMVYWQHRSVLFEVGLCVMLYLTVLCLEFAPVVLEHRAFDRPLFRAVLRFLKRATIPLVIAGIVLSTLHQSSLGSLFLIAPYRVYPLWYSPIIYVLFFVSAVGLGLMMVVIESLLSSYFLGHKVQAREISGLGLAASAVLWLYLALRLGDLALRGVLGMALNGSGHAALFLFEIGFGAVLPATLLLFRRIRSSMYGLGVCAVLTALGVVFYRMGVSVFSFAEPRGVHYFPSWEEFAVSLGIVAGTSLVFIFFAEHLGVYDDVKGRPAAEWTPGYDPATLHGLLPRRLAGPRRNTAAALGGAALALFFLPLEGSHPVRTPTAEARVVEGVSGDRPGGGGEVIFLAGGNAREHLKRPKRRLLLLIDGNRNGNAVLFDHNEHVARLGGDDACPVCHHLNLPLNRGTGCYACHRDMYSTSSAFDHEAHAVALGGNAGCVQCHSKGVEVKSYATSTACVKCHRDRGAVNPVIAPPPRRWHTAPSYLEAMHGLCIPCHRRALAESPGRYPADLDQCRNCHNVDLKHRLQQLEPARGEGERAAAGRGNQPPKREGG